MSDTPIITAMLARGWREQENRFTRARSIFAPTSERAGLRWCECNSKPPSLCLYEYPPHTREQDWLSYEVEICGKRNGIWLMLKAYSLTSADEIERGITEMKKAWQGQGTTNKDDTP